MNTDINDNVAEMLVGRLQWQTMDSCPENDEDMIFTIDTGRVVFGHRCDDFAEYRVHGYIMGTNVTSLVCAAKAIAWMPIPEAYKP